MKVIETVSQENAIEEAVRYTASSHIAQECSRKLGAELATKSVGFSGKVQLDESDINKTELLQALETTLNARVSVSWSFAKEQEIKHTISASSSGRTIDARIVLFPQHWDVYLYSVEHMELEYRKNWPWTRIRKTIKHSLPVHYKLPLFRLTFYDWQPVPVLFEKSVTNIIDDISAIEVEDLNGAFPNVWPDAPESLEDLAKVAFPQTKQERKVAARKRAERAAKAARRLRRDGGGPGGLRVKKKAAKRVVAKKARIKKVSKKKAAKRVVAKKARMKKAAKRRAVKRKARRR